MVRIILWTLAGGAGGFVIGATIASLYAAITNMSRAEGGVGVFAAGIGVIACFLGMIITLLVLLHARGAGVSGLVRGSLAVVLGLALLLGYARWSYLRSQDHFTKTYGWVMLDVELLPPAQKPLPTAPPNAELVENDLRDQVVWKTEKTEGVPQRRALRGQARASQLTSTRALVVRTEDGETRTFPVVLPRDPSKASDQWSNWSGGEGQNWTIRYRVHPAVQ